MTVGQFADRGVGETLAAAVEVLKDKGFSGARIADVAAPLSPKPV